MAAEFVKPYISDIVDRVSKVLEEEAKGVVDLLREEYLAALRPVAQKRAETLSAHLHTQFPDVFPDGAMTAAAAAATDAAADASKEKVGDLSSSSLPDSPDATPVATPNDTHESSSVAKFLHGVAVEAFRAAVKDQMDATVKPALAAFVASLEEGAAELPQVSDEFLRDVLNTQVKRLARAASKIHAANAAASTSAATAPATATAVALHSRSIRRKTRRMMGGGGGALLFA